jgi:hypothetical protein
MQLLYISTTQNLGHVQKNKPNTYTKCSTHGDSNTDSKSSDFFKIFPSGPVTDAPYIFTDKTVQLVPAIERLESQRDSALPWPQDK